MQLKPQWKRRPNIVLTSRTQALNEIDDLISKYCEAATLSTPLEKLMDRTNYHSRMKRCLYGGGKYDNDVRRNLLNYIDLSSDLLFSERVNVVFVTCLEIIDKIWSLYLGQGRPLYRQELRNVLQTTFPSRFKKNLLKYTSQDKPGEVSIEVNDQPVETIWPELLDLTTKERIFVDCLLKGFSYSDIKKVLGIETRMYFYMLKQIKEKLYGTNFRKSVFNVSRNSRKTRTD